MAMINPGSENASAKAYDSTSPTAASSFAAWAIALRADRNNVLDAPFCNALGTLPNMNRSIMVSQAVYKIEFIAFNLKGLEGAFIRDQNGVMMIFQDKHKLAFKLVFPQLATASSGNVFYFNSHVEFEEIKNRLTMYADFLIGKVIE